MAREGGNILHDAYRFIDAPKDNGVLALVHHLLGRGHIMGTRRAAFEDDTTSIPRALASQTVGVLPIGLGALAGSGIGRVLGGPGGQLAGGLLGGLAMSPTGNDLAYSVRKSLDKTFGSTKYNPSDALYRTVSGTWGDADSSGKSEKEASINMDKLASDVALRVIEKLNQ